MTKQGTKEFGLSNTNKLLKMATNFEVTGLKTGSTSIAKYCLSATAKRMEWNSSPRSWRLRIIRQDLRMLLTLLNYGFGNCRLYKDETPPKLPKIPVTGGKVAEAELSYGDIFTCLGSTGRIFPVWSGN